MVRIKKIFILLSAIVIIVPLFSFEFQSNIKSDIDNRFLTEIPLGVQSTDYTKDWENYINDRIGFRNQAINLYTEMNDVLFHQMEHPSYQYGKDDWVFAKLIAESDNQSYLSTFVDFLEQIQNYCQLKKIPFIFVLDPSKITICQQYLPDGYTYKNDNTNYLIKELDNRKINYVNNIDYISEKFESEQVFNKQYDAGHWNDLGNYYGVDHILSKLNEYCPTVENNNVSKFDVDTIVQTTLPVSKFPISEKTPNFVLKSKVAQKYEDLSNQTRESVVLNGNYNTLYHYKSKDSNENKVLFFQGSYLNRKPELIYAGMDEYIGIHAYQNILNFEQYIEQFTPDCVVFESAEYVFLDDFYDSVKMKEKTEELKNKYSLGE